MGLHFIQDITGRLQLGLGGMFRLGRLNSLRMSDVVQPVVSVESYIGETVFDKAAKDISAAAGTFVEYFVVPDNEEWHVLVCVREGTTGGSFIAAQRGATYYWVSGGTTGALETIYGSLILITGDSLGMMTTGNGADNSIELHVEYMKYKIR